MITKLVSYIIGEVEIELEEELEVNEAKKEIEDYLTEFGEDEEYIGAVSRLVIAEAESIEALEALEVLVDEGGEEETGEE